MSRDIAESKQGNKDSKRHDFLLQKGNDYKDKIK